MSEDRSALDHLRAWLDVINARRDQESLEEASLIKRQAAAAGRLASGATLHQLIKQAADDVRIRSELYLKALEDTWSSYRPGPSAHFTARVMLIEALSDAATARLKFVKASAPSLGLGALPQSVWDGIKDETSQFQTRFALKLQEWTLIQKQPERPAGSAQTTTITLTGNNNNVVAGLMNSSANMQLDAGAQERVLAALASVRAAIESSKALPESDANDTLELIRDAEGELTRAQPNKRKLKLSLEGVAATIQTVGAMGDAYSVLKNAMALIGLPLP